MEEKSIFIYYLFPNIYTYISEYYFQNSLYAYCQILTLRHKNGVYFESYKNLEVLLKIQWICVVIQPFCQKKF